MDCAKVKTILNEHIDGTLTDGSRTSVEDHLGSCPGCDRELKGLLQVRAALQGVPHFKAPAGFSSRVMEGVRLEKRRSAKAPGIFGWIWELPGYLKIAEAVAAAIVITAGVYSAEFISDGLLKTNVALEQAEAGLEVASLDAVSPESMGDIYLSMGENGNEQ